MGRIKNGKPDAGFTLVELAIVMVIIGLLLGGLLKGQELIANSRITATIAQIKGFEVAWSAFEDKYGVIPGDVPNANNRIPNCATVVCAPALTPPPNGNARIDSADFNGFGGENRAFFVQLNRAGLLSGIDTNLGDVWGGSYPAAVVGGGFVVSYVGGLANLSNPQGVTAAALRTGHYLGLHGGAPWAAVPAVGVMTPNHAFRIDHKLDDGLPATGDVLAAGAATCINVAVYNESSEMNDCNLYIRIHE